jgi:hypothetical protein
MIPNKTSKYNLVLCELHYTPIHGKTATSCPTIESHYILINCFDPFTGMPTESNDSDYDSDYDSDTDSDSDSSEVDETIEGVQDLYNDEYEAMTINIPHKTIRNYSNIVRRHFYIQPQIALCIELPTGENITIIKTIWIKLIQRAWKRIYKRRQTVINGRAMIDSLNCRRLTGFWPEMYREMPGLKYLLNL